MDLLTRYPIPPWIVRLFLGKDNRQEEDRTPEPLLQKRSGPLASRLHTTLLLDTCHFLDRSDLTICQLVCRRWDALVERHADHLPIYYFHSLRIPFDYRAQEQFDSNDNNESNPPKMRLFDESHCCSGVTDCMWKVGGDH
jgi:hypothetical protein